MTFPPITDLVPHTGGAVLLAEVLAADDEKIRCRAEIGPHTWFATADGVSSTVCLELMAQTVAAFAGVRAFQTGQPVKNAFLVSSRELDIEVPHLEMGDVVEIEAHVIFAHDSPLASFSGAVYRDGELVASGTVNVYEGEKVLGGE